MVDGLLDDIVHRVGVAIEVGIVHIEDTVTSTAWRRKRLAKRAKSKET